MKVQPGEPRYSQCQQCRGLKWADARPLCFTCAMIAQQAGAEFATADESLDIAVEMECAPAWKRREYLAARRARDAGRGRDGR